MKKIKLILGLSIALIGTLLLSNCQNNDFEDLVQKEQFLEKKKQSKFIYYQGLKVKKRFLASEEELKTKKDKKSLKKIYNKLRKEAKKSSKTQGKKSKISYVIDEVPIEDVELPNPEVIFEAAKIVLSEFPYEEIEGYIVIYRPNPTTVNHEMIKDDFPELSDAEIETNESIIDDYYSDNLDYMVLNEIAQNPAIYENISPQKGKSVSINNEAWTALCTLTTALAHGYGLVRPSISYFLASSKSVSSSTSKYNNTNLSGSNDRRDAYRHMLWNSLLANYYFTISSKSKRLGFAKLVTDLREGSYCGTSNAIDARAMDYHNNYIGRELWNNNTDYLKIFGFTVGLYLPPTSLLETLTYNMVERESCYIIKDHPNNNYKYSEVETKNLILQTNINTPVYIKGSIAPVSYVASIELEYYDCDSNFIPSQKNTNSTLFSRIPDPNEGKCTREITVYTPVYPCYITKDSNYNPY